MTRLFLILALLAGPALADTRPTPRPALDVEIMSTRGSTEVPDIAAIPMSIRPVQRLTVDDRLAQVVAAAIRSPEPRIDTSGVVRLSDRPLFRPDDIILAASRTPRGSQGNGLCGRTTLQGAPIAPVVGNGACGIANPVRIIGVSGVALSQPTRMTCDAARALDDWVRTGVLPTVGRQGGGVVALRVAAGYACRTRNSQSGAKISEHAKGNAIDISAFQLANGDRITVLTDWNQGAYGRMLRAMWQKACGPFGTVLGPDSDRYHRDHFHFDVAAYRSGSYCR